MMYVTNNEPKKVKHRDFALLRHFTLTAIVSIAVAAIFLGGYYKHSFHTQILSDAQHHHREIARLYRNFIWPIYGDYLLTKGADSPSDKIDTLLYAGLHNGIKREIFNSHVLKLKIFNRQGLTVYSSDPTQVGQIKKGYAGFESAMLGEITSDLSFRKEFDRGEQREIIKNINVYSSYIPVYDDFEEKNIIAAIEIYSDVTDIVEHSTSNGIKLLLVTVLVMLTLFTVLLVNIKKADMLIRMHEDQEQKLKEKAFWKANHDELTNLPNRGYFNELLQDSLRAIENTDQIIALMYIDLDHFKPINDAYGHHTGDLVLQDVAKRIHIALPAGAVVARPGGDEFTAFFRVSRSNPDTSIQAQELLDVLSMPFQFDNTQCSLSASIGITYCDNPDIDINESIADADKAMYISKKTGRSKAHVFEENSRDRAA